MATHEHWPLTNKKDSTVLTWILNQDIIKCFLKEWFPISLFNSPTYLSTTKACCTSFQHWPVHVLFQDMWQAAGNSRGTGPSTHCLPGWMKKMCLNERPIKVNIMCHHKDLLYISFTLKSNPLELCTLVVILSDLIGISTGTFICINFN